MENKLAIIIPAYKTSHIEEVFRCIKNQTCQRFDLYVFDDASPYDIRSYFNRYFTESDHVHFHRFEENMGGLNLSEHWNRCLQMTGEEEWVWYFSDDDIMSIDCVESFYENLQNPDVCDVMRFTLNGTNEANEFLSFRNPETTTLTCEEFFSQIYLGKIDARMPEFILRRSKLLQIGGFVPYDLAWRSDNATVMRMTYPHYIYNLPKGEVLWRWGEDNISGLDALNKRKNAVTVQFFNWVDDFFKTHGLKYAMTEEELLKIYAYSLLPEKDASPLEILSDIATKLKLITTEEQRKVFMLAGEKSLVMHICNGISVPLEKRLDYVTEKNQKHLKLFRLVLVVSVIELTIILLMLSILLGKQHFAI